MPDAEKRKRRPVARWQILLVAGILIFIAVWSINAASQPQPVGWWITKTVEMESTYHMQAVTTAAAYFELTKTAYAAEAQTILATEPPAMDEFAVTATHFVFITTQTAYVHQLEMQAFNSAVTATSEAKNR